MPSAKCWHLARTLNPVHACGHATRFTSDLPGNQRLQSIPGTHQSLPRYLNYQYPSDLTVGDRFQRILMHIVRSWHQLWGSKANAMRHACCLSHVPQACIESTSCILRTLGNL
jgi:hypothetical protein